MTEPAVNLGRDLIRIHKVITRSIEVGRRSGNQYLDTGFSNPEELSGYSKYVHSLGATLGAHHTSEDEVIFPALQKVLPMAPYARLSSDHQQIVALLTPLPQAIADLAGDTPEKGARIIVDTLDKISVVWYPHIQLEESHFSEQAVNAAFTQEEQRQLGEASSKITQAHANPPYWVVPFVLFNLEPEERAKMAAALPPTIMQELVPKVWKEQWSPMKPFLLE